MVYWFLPPFGTRLFRGILARLSSGSTLGSVRSSDRQVMYKKDVRGRNKPNEGAKHEHLRFGIYHAGAWGFFSTRCGGKKLHGAAAVIAGLARPHNRLACRANAISLQKRLQKMSHMLMPNCVMWALFGIFSRAITHADKLRNAPTASLGA